MGTCRIIFAGGREGLQTELQPPRYICVRVDNQELLLCSTPVCIKIEIHEIHEIHQNVPCICRHNMLLDSVN